MSALLLIGGILLVGLAGYDATVTTISTTSAGGPLTSRLGGGWWSVAHRCARRPTSRIVATAGPVILLGTIATWLGLLWLGWTLVFAADPTSVVATNSRVPASFADVAYFAGFTAFTLGVGDYVPVGMPWQLMTVIATISGLGLTTAAITYVMPVVTAVNDRNTQAASIAGLGGDAYAIVGGAWCEGSLRILEPILLDLTPRLLLTAERHLAYPILHYFHPRSAIVELRVQLAVLDDALTLVEYGIDADVQRPHPTVIDGARAAIERVIERSPTSPAGAVPPLDLRLLRSAGIPVTDDTTFSERLALVAARREKLANYAAESKWHHTTR